MNPLIEPDRHSQIYLEVYMRSSESWTLSGGVFPDIKSFHCHITAHSSPCSRESPVCLLSASCLNKMFASLPEPISGLQREDVPGQTAVCLQLHGDTGISFALVHALAAIAADSVTYLIHPKLRNDCKVSVCVCLCATAMQCVGIFGWIYLWMFFVCVACGYVQCVCGWDKKLAFLPSTVLKFKKNQHRTNPRWVHKHPSGFTTLHMGCVGHVDKPTLCWASRSQEQKLSTTHRSTLTGPLSFAASPLGSVISWHSPGMRWMRDDQQMWQWMRWNRLHL